MKAQQSGRTIFTAPMESVDEMTLSIDFEAAQGPADALLAEISFILAESQPRETTVSAD